MDSSFMQELLCAGKELHEQGILVMLCVHNFQGSAATCCTVVPA